MEELQLGYEAGPVCVYSHLHQLIKHHSVKAREVLDVVALHDGAVLPDVGPELLHVEDELGYVSARQHGSDEEDGEDTASLRLQRFVSAAIWVCILVDKVVCALLLDVVGVSQ